jgi:hypothetical protein
MSNQRGGRYHSAAMNDEGGGNITLQQLISFFAKAQDALEGAEEPDSALRFEIVKDWLKEDVTNGAPFVFSTKVLGL